MPSGVVVEPTYGSIEAVRDLCEPWIELWGGDEWGESMEALRMAAHVDYGFSDEDCALFAAKLLENLFGQREWARDNEDLFAPGDEAGAQQLCRERRDYWLAGANVPGNERIMEAAAATVAQLPGWMFGE